MCRLEEYPDEQYLIVFDRKNLRGVVGTANNGHDVYVDSYSGMDVQYGESWYCNLIRKENGDNYYYFANPVYRVGTPSGGKDSRPDHSANTIAEEPAPAVWRVEENERSLDNLRGFVAIGDDTIFSPRLSAARYKVYRSLNGEHLEIIPDSEGDIPCIRNAIAIESLDRILGSEFPILLKSTEEGDRILLDLTS